MKNIINLALAFVLIFTSNAPVFAQHLISRPNQGFGNLDNLNSMSSVEFLNKMAKQNPANNNPFEKLPPIFDKNYPKAAAQKAMRDYNRTVEDYTTHPASKFTPNEVLNAMKYETNKMAKYLAKNPRYKKEVTKANWINAGVSCVNGILMGVMLVLCAPVATAYGGAGAGAWYGVASTSVGAVTTYATVSLGRALFVVALLEMFTMLGQELMDKVYSNLTKRLLKYNYLENQAEGRAVVKNAAEGSILNENVLETLNGQACENPSEIKFSSRWIDREAKREAIIRLAGLQAINGYLQFSSDKTKYDMALLDILSLFTDAPVKFDEKVFTREVIENGEQKTVRNTNIVDINPGRLMPRSAHLTKALAAIQSM